MMVSPHDISSFVFRNLFSSSTQRNETMEPAWWIPDPIKYFFHTFQQLNWTISSMPLQQKKNMKNQCWSDVFHHQHQCSKECLETSDEFRFWCKKKSFNILFYGTSTTCASIKINALNMGKFWKFSSRRMFFREQTLSLKINETNINEVKNAPNWHRMHLIASYANVSCVCHMLVT